jgi:hypothetical protein
MQSRDRAVIALMGGVVLYDLTSAPGQTISEALDDYLEKHPVLTCACVGLTAAHLLNRLPWWVDVWGLFFKASARVLRKQLDESS